jgi:hypothetical protein
MAEPFSAAKIGGFVRCFKLKYDERHIKLKGKTDET